MNLLSKTAYEELTNVEDVRFEEYMQRASERRKSDDCRNRGGVGQRVIPADVIEGGSYEIRADGTLVCFPDRAYPLTGISSTQGMPGLTAEVVLQRSGGSIVASLTKQVRLLGLAVGDKVRVTVTYAEQEGE